ncbi:MAG: DinB family protein [Phycisphaerales bacterium]
MTARVAWTKRTFCFDPQWEIYPELIERLRGTPARVRMLIDGVNPSSMTKRIGDRWSIQENIAHLADMDEILWLPRIEQFEKGEDRLHAADMTNRTTNAADHNSKSTIEVLRRHEDARARMIAKLESLSHETFGRVALHPRLNIQMRLTHHLTFVADHDDYHMAHISGLKRDANAK